MKMFLTRLGNNSKAIITGDITQIDLPYLRKSGLVDALEILENIKGISIFRFTHKDVVRHPLVQKIIQAYEKRDASNTQRRENSDSPRREVFRRR
jgi:phosphate starvation-inducible PhoH-like protein